MSDPPTPSKPRRRWLRRLGLVLLGVALLLLAAAAREGWRHRRVSRELEEALARQDRDHPGWRLADIQAAREEIPDDENSALCIVAAAKQLPDDWYDSYPESLLDQVPPQERLTEEEAARLEQFLEKVQQTLRTARRLADLPRGRYAIVYARNPVETLFPDFQTAREIGWILRCDATHHAQAGNPGQALVSCRGILNVGRSFADEPGVIPQIIRMTTVKWCCEQVECILAQGEPPPDELARLQRALAEEIGHPAMRIAMRGERAMIHETFDAVESGDNSLSEVKGGQPDWRERWLGWRVRDYLRGEHPLMLSFMNRLVEITELPLHEQAAVEQPFVAEVTARNSEAALTNALLPAVEQILRMFRLDQAIFRCAVAALACERYRQAEGKWPAKLGDLVPEYLDEVPADPHDGKELRLARVPEGLVIYSVGPDRTDDGGTFDREKPDAEGTDQGFQLWHPEKRRQPRSAKEEEF